MSERYQRAFAVPEDFPALLKTFTREILRAQPENLYEFGARYFAELVEVRLARTRRRRPVPPARTSPRAPALPLGWPTTCLHDKSNPATPASVLLSLRRWG